MDKKKFNGHCVFNLDSEKTSQSDHFFLYSIDNILIPFQTNFLRYTLRGIYKETLHYNNEYNKILFKNPHKIKTAQDRSQDKNKSLSLAEVRPLGNNVKYELKDRVLRLQRVQQVALTAPCSRLYT